MAILGIDYGKKRIGIAKSDELNMFAHGVGYIDNTNLDAVCVKLREYGEEFSVTKIIVGLPRRMNGELGPAADDILAFVDVLRDRFDCEVMTWDERLTTKGADRFLAESGMTQKKKRQKVDQLASQIILQTYLDSLRFHG